MDPDEEVESALLKFLGTRHSGAAGALACGLLGWDVGWGCASFVRDCCLLLESCRVIAVDMPFALAVQRFNCNVDYSGLVHAVTADGWFKENKVPAHAS